MYDNFIDIPFLAKSVYRPLDQQKIYTSCSDAMVRGGIVPNPGQPVSIIFKVIIYYLMMKYISLT